MHSNKCTDIKCENVFSQSNCNRTLSASQMALLLLFPLSFSWFCPLHKHNHVAYALLCLASFTQNYACDSIYNTACSSKSYFSFLCSILLYEYTTIYLIYSVIQSLEIKNNTAMTSLYMFSDACMHVFLLDLN